MTEQLTISSATASQDRDDVALLPVRHANLRQVRAPNAGRVHLSGLPEGAQAAVRASAYDGLCARGRGVCDPGGYRQRVADAGELVVPDLPVAACGHTDLRDRLAAGGAALWPASVVIVGAGIVVGALPALGMSLLPLLVASRGGLSPFRRPHLGLHIVLAVGSAIARLRMT